MSTLSCRSSSGRHSALPSCRLPRSAARDFVVDLATLWDMPFMRTTGKGGARLFYAVEGRGDECVVFLHGLAGHAGEWSATAEAIGNSRRTVRLDQRGHGQSSIHLDMSREAFADDVAAVIRASSVAMPVILVGQSMGAHTALVAADRHPEFVKHPPSTLVRAAD